MTTYTATFSDGSTATESTARECGVAWKVTGPDGRVATGFSKNEKAAQSQISFFSSLCSVPAMDKSKAAEKARAENAEYRKGCAVEIVRL